MILAIKIKLAGFDDLLKEIEQAGGKAESATVQCMKKSADIMQNELKSQMQKVNKTGTLNGLIERLPPPKVKNDHGLITASVGYEKGAYNAKNPSDAHKAVFLNYGTPSRKKHGVEAARGFIRKAKNKAKKPIAQQQEETLKEILKGLKK